MLSASHRSHTLPKAAIVSPVSSLPGSLSWTGRVRRTQCALTTLWWAKPTHRPPRLPHNQGSHKAKVAYSSNTAVRQSQRSLPLTAGRVASGNFASTGSLAYSLAHPSTKPPLAPLLQPASQPPAVEYIGIYSGPSLPPSALLARCRTRQLRIMQRSLLAGSSCPAAIHSTTQQAASLLATLLPTLLALAVAQGNLACSRFASSAFAPTTTSRMVQLRLQQWSLLATWLHHPTGSFASSAFAPTQWSLLATWLHHPTGSFASSALSLPHSGRY